MVVVQHTAMFGKQQTPETAFTPQTLIKLPISPQSQQLRLRTIRRTPKALSVTAR